MTGAPEKNDAPLTLICLTTDGAAATVACDSVRLWLPDGAVGIRRGHMSALMATAAGPLEAYRGGARVFCRTAAEGVAWVESDRVTVLCGTLGKSENNGNEAILPE